MSVNCKLISKSYDLSTHEENKNVYLGKYISQNKDTSTFQYAFKVEDNVMRLSVVIKKDEIIIEQNFTDASSKMNFSLKKRGVYNLKLSNGYELSFITDTNELKINDFYFFLKYNLIDTASKEVISFNEISLVGEKEIC